MIRLIWGHNMLPIFIRRELSTDLIEYAFGAPRNRLLSEALGLGGGACAPGCGEVEPRLPPRLQAGERGSGRDIMRQARHEHAATHRSCSTAPHAAGR